MNIMNVDYSTKIPNNVKSQRGSPGAQGAGGLASRLHGLVERHGAGRLPAIAGLSAHRLFGRSARLGQVRLRQDAGLSLGHPAGAAGREPRHSVRRELRQAGLAGSPGRASRHPAPPDRDPGRHRAGLGRAAAPSRQDRALALRPAQSVPGQCRGRPPSLGDGLSAAESISAATAARRPTICCAAAPAMRIHRACSAPSTRRRRTGCRSSCSPTSPTATARCSCTRWRSPASIRCRAPAASC